MLELELADVRYVANADCTEMKPWEGDSYVIEPCRDGWVDGNEPVTLYESNIEATEHFAEVPE